MSTEVLESAVYWTPTHGQGHSCCNSATAGHTHIEKPLINPLHAASFYTIFAVIEKKIAFSIISQHRDGAGS